MSIPHVLLAADPEISRLVKEWQEQAEEAVRVGLRMAERLLQRSAARGAAMNRCNPDLWDAIKQSATLLENLNVTYLLIGSAALAAHGVNIEAPDADFLCLEKPGTMEQIKGGSGGWHTDVGGWKIDHIFFDDGRLDSFFGRASQVIDGVRVATPGTVMDIKRFADRAKDREDFNDWASLLAGVAQ